MKCFVLALALMLGTASAMFAQSSFTFEKFPYDDTILNHFGEKSNGCACGIDSHNSKPQLKGIAVSPTAVRTPLNTRVQIRYDASAICKGQGILDAKGADYAQKNFGGVGTITWETGVVQTLPDIWGIVTYSGYTQTTQQSIKIDLNLYCWDSAGGPGCDRQSRNQCSASVEIPVTIGK